ncbi:MAG: T9SS type A sorting domain-containing protein [Chitinophagales bacterium]
MKTIFIGLLCLVSILNADAQSNKTFFLGHSLINFDVPNMVNKFSMASGETFSYDANIGNGANLLWHWENPTTGQGSQWDLTLPLGGYENFVLTEAVPLENHLQFSNTYGIANNLCSFANQYNPNIQYYLYETWHCTNSGNGSTSGSGGTACDWDPGSNILWRDRIDLDLSKWESIADSVNLIHTNPMLIIPAGQALGRLADHIESGAVPGLTSIFDLFGDEYHLDLRGNYFIACVVYAVLHGVSPVGLPNQVTNEFGGLYTVFPTPEQAAIMQEIAWQTVCDYPRDGVDCSTVDLPTIDKEDSNISIYPVPANNQLSIQLADSFSKMDSYSICDRLGRIVLGGALNSKVTLVNLTELPSGMYFLKVKDEVFKFVKSE